MADIPQEGGIDHSLAFFSEGYDFITRRCRQFSSDIFITRLLGKRFHCIRGRDAAEMFYTPDRFSRAGALPNSVLHLLQDEGSVAVLDAEAHRHRKAVFLSLMTPDRLGAIADLTAQELRRRLSSHSGGGEIVMHDEFRAVLVKAACDWAGIDLQPDQMAGLIGEIGAMIDKAGSVGPRNWAARIRRHGAERMLRQVVQEVRESRRHPPEGSAASVIALHREADGKPLDVEIAAVELLNILRPTAAVARFMTFAMLALHDHPGARSRLAEDDAFLEAFIHEVRRFYPFFPVAAGKARQDFVWRGHSFEKGALFMLDLYGTCHDEYGWTDPMRFLPERFIGWEGDPFTLIPQGGGDHLLNHRCAGEWLTIEVMKAMLRVIAGEAEYEVPEQNLSVDLTEFPALPKSGFRVRIAGIR